MELNGLADEPQGFLPGFADSNTSGQIRDIRSPTRRPFFNNDRKSHDPLLLLEPHLLEHIIECSGRHLNAGFSRNRHGSRFRGMPELPAASALASLNPAVGFKTFDRIPDLHRTRSIS
jgi:hypothetical protein